MLYDGCAGPEMVVGGCELRRATGIMASVNLQYRTFSLKGLHVNRRDWIDGVCNTELSYRVKFKPPTDSSLHPHLAAFTFLTSLLISWVLNNQREKKWSRRDNIFFTWADRAAKNSRFHLGEGLVFRRCAGASLRCSVLLAKMLECFQVAVQGSNMQCHHAPLSQR